MTELTDLDREIRSLDLCTAAFLTVLDQLFEPIMAKWTPVTTTSSGVNIEVTDKNKRGVFVNIHPVEWPERSLISLRLQKLQNGWNVIEGDVWAHHIDDPSNEDGRGLHLSFEYSGIPDVPMHPRRIKPQGSSDRRLLEYLRE